MRFSYAWLVALSGTKRSVREIADALTQTAFEVEEVVPLDAGLEQVVVGRVRHVRPHPDADRLRVASVDVGEETERQIVCGAPNLAEGQMVAVALPGAVLPTPDGAGFAITKSVIRGVESNGMICAEDELGLGEDHEGIMVLPDDAPVGVPFAQYMGLDDTAMEIDILPNRAHDCLSHEGVAREIAALDGQTITIDTPSAVPCDTTVPVAVQTSGCDTYSATYIDGVDNTVASSRERVARLRTCGLRSINALVDISNEIMLRTGQPSHIFDADTVHGTLTVRNAQEGETITLLDGREITLSADDMVIADDTSVLALAGVMGGASSAVSENTTRIIVEVAHFDPVRIRATRVRHGISSDAAFRFERDPDACGVERVRTILEAEILATCGGTCRARGEHRTQSCVPRDLTVSPVEISRLLGISVSGEEIVSLLARVGIDARNDGKTVRCTVPTWRADVHTMADIAEEVGRLYGYDRIPPQALCSDVVAPPRNEARNIEHRTREIWVGGGYDEVRTYAFYSADDARSIGLDVTHHVTIQNPLSQSLTHLRRTLVHSLTRAVARNLTHSDDVRIFEIGRTFIPSKIETGLPMEYDVLAAAVALKATDGTPFFILKGMVEAYVTTMGISGVTFDDAMETEGYDSVDLHPSRRAIIRSSEGECIGIIGEMTRSCARQCGVKTARVAVMEFDLASVRTLSTASQPTFVPLPTFPAVWRDISMTVGARTHVADIERRIREAGGELLEDVALFDSYTDDNGTRSLAFRLTFRAPDRTLSGTDVDAMMEAIMEAVETEEGVHVKQ